MRQDLVIRQRRRRAQLHLRVIGHAFKRDGDRGGAGIGVGPQIDHRDQRAAEGDPPLREIKPPVEDRKPAANQIETAADDRVLGRAGDPHIAAELGIDAASAHENRVGGRDGEVERHGGARFAGLRRRKLLRLPEHGLRCVLMHDVDLRYRRRQPVGNDDRRAGKRQPAGKRRLGQDRSFQRQCAVGRGRQQSSVIDDRIVGHELQRCGKTAGQSDAAADRQRAAGGEPAGDAVDLHPVPGKGDAPADIVERNAAPDVGQRADREVDAARIARARQRAADRHVDIGVAGNGETGIGGKCCGDLHRQATIDRQVQRPVAGEPDRAGGARVDALRIGDRGVGRHLAAVIATGGGDVERLSAKRACLGQIAVVEAEIVVGRGAGRRAARRHRARDRAAGAERGNELVGDRGGNAVDVGRQVQPVADAAVHGNRAATDPEPQALDIGRAIGDGDPPGFDQPKAETHRRAFEPPEVDRHRIPAVHGRFQRYRLTVVAGREVEIRRGVLVAGRKRDVGDGLTGHGNRTKRDLAACLQRRDIGNRHVGVEISCGYAVGGDAVASGVDRQAQPVIGVVELDAAGDRALGLLAGEAGEQLQVRKIEADAAGGLELAVEDNVAGKRVFAHRAINARDLDLAVIGGDVCRQRKRRAGIAALCGKRAGGCRHVRLALDRGDEILKRLAGDVETVGSHRGVDFGRGQFAADRGVKHGRALDLRREPSEFGDRRLQRRVDRPPGDADIAAGGQQPVFHLEIGERHGAGRGREEEIALDPGHVVDQAGGRIGKRVGEHEQSGVAGRVLRLKVIIDIGRGADAAAFKRDIVELHASFGERHPRLERKRGLDHPVEAFVAERKAFNRKPGIESAGAGGKVKALAVCRQRNAACRDLRQGELRERDRCR